MTRRTWFRTITGAFSTLATGLGLRKVEKKPFSEYEITTYVGGRLHSKATYVNGILYSRAVWRDYEWHFEDVKPEEDM